MSSTSFTTIFDSVGLRVATSVGLFVIVYVSVERGIEATRIWALGDQQSQANRFWCRAGTILALVDGLAVAGTVLAVDGLLWPTFGATAIGLLALVSARLRHVVSSRSNTER